MWSLTQDILKHELNSSTNRNINNILTFLTSAYIFSTVAVYTYFKEINDGWLHPKYVSELGVLQVCMSLDLDAIP